MRNLTVWQAVLVASQLGFVMATTVALGLIAGWYLDSLMHTSPTLTMVGALMGLASGLYSCVQIIRSTLGNRRS